MNRINLFFILFAASVLINSYTIYTYINQKFLHNQQGSKLKLKNLITKGDLK